MNMNLTRAKEKYQATDWKKIKNCELAQNHLIMEASAATHWKWCDQIEFII